MTFDGTTGQIKYYVGDGTNLTLDATIAARPEPSGAVATAAYIGANSDTTRNLNGLIDDLRIYGMYEGTGGVLSSQQIVQVMQEVDHGAEDVSWVPQGNLYVAHGPDANSAVKRYAVSGGAATFAENLVTGLNNARGLERVLDGNLVVAERDNARVLKGANGLAPGSFSAFATGINKPRGIAVRPGNGHMYVGEWEDSEVSWYDTNGTYQSKFAFGYNVHDVAFAGEDEMYVVGANYAKRYDWNGSTWDQTWSANLSGGSSMAAEVVNGHLYVALQASPSKILRVNRASGAVLSSWYSGGVASTFAPLAGDSAGNLYISDWTGNSLFAVRVNASGDPDSFRRLATGTSSSPGWLVAVMQFVPQVNNGQGATNVTSGSAWLNGTVVATNGQATSAWVYWGMTDGGTNAANWSATNAFGVVGEGPLTHQVTGLTANRFYCYRFAASNATGTVWSDASGFFTGSGLSVAATVPRTSAIGGMPPGAFTVSRPQAATNGPLTVFYSLTGSAQNGIHYESLPGQVTLPAGSVSATVDVTPILVTVAEKSRVVNLALAAGPYMLGTPPRASVVLLNFAQFETVAGYRVDFAPTHPPAGWRYQWNQNSTVGNATGYVDLLWNATQSRYTVNGIPTGTGNNYAFLDGTKAHPGPGTLQTESLGTNRMVIAGFAVPDAGFYRIRNGWVYRSNTSNLNGVQVHVYVNDAFKVQTPRTYHPATNSFDTGLGELSAGDVVFVAIDPAGDHGYDQSEWDFTIERGVSPPRGTMVLLH